MPLSNLLRCCLNIVLLLGVCLSQMATPSNNVIANITPISQKSDDSRTTSQPVTTSIIKLFPSFQLPRSFWNTGPTPPDLGQTHSPKNPDFLFDNVTSSTISTNKSIPFELLKELQKIYVKEALFTPERNGTGEVEGPEHVNKTKQSVFTATPLTNFGDKKIPAGLTIPEPQAESEDSLTDEVPAHGPPMLEDPTMIEWSNDSSSKISHDSGSTWMDIPQHLCVPEMSCMGRCSEEIQSFHDIQGVFVSNTSSGFLFHCKCDSFCKVLGDCCQDYYEECAGKTVNDAFYDYLSFYSAKTAYQLYDVPERALENTVNMYGAFGTCDRIEYYIEPTELFPSGFGKIMKGAASIWLISSCPSYFWLESTDTTKEIMNQCEVGARDRLFSFPVHYRWEPGLIFRNVFCAMCHSFYLSDVMFWDAVSFCQWYDDVSEVPDTISLDVIKKFFHYNSTCSNNSGPIIPSSAKPRTCLESSRYVASCHAAFLEGPGFDISKHDDLKNLQTLCRSYIKPIVINSVLYSNPHCALCGHVPQSEIVSTASCFRPFDSITEVLTFTSSKVTFFKGKVHSVIHASGKFIDFYYDLSSNECPDTPDPRNTYLGRCLKACNDDLTFDVSLYMSEEKKRCFLLSRYAYKERYTTISPFQDYFPLHIKLGYWQTYRHADITLLYVRKFLTEIYLRTRQCDSLSPCEVPVLRFMSVNRKYIEISWPIATPYFEIIQMTYLLIKEMNENEFATYLGHIEFTSIDRFEIICPLGDIIHFHEMSLIRYQDDFYFWNATVNCLFPLKNIGFQINNFYSEGLPTTVYNIAMCWDYDLQLYCGIQKPNVNPLIPEIQEPTQPDVPEIFTGKPLMGRPTTDKNHPEEPKPTSKVLTETLKSPVSGSDISTFKTVCFTTCASCLLLSLLLDLIARSQTGPSALVLAVSKIVLCVQMTLFLISENVSNADVYGLGLSAHFCWLLLPLLVNMSFIFRKFGNGDRAEENLASHSSQETSASPRKIKVVLSSVLFALLIVILCIILDTEKSITLDFGYSSNSGHVFWITNELACYISLIGVSALLYMTATVVLCVKISKVFRHGKKGDDQHVQNRSGRMLSGDIGIGNHGHAVHEMCLLFMFMWAVCDYVDQDKELWFLMFCLCASVTGLYSLHSSIVCLVTHHHKMSLLGMSEITANTLGHISRTEGDGEVCVKVTDDNDTGGK